ncbi:MAG: histidine kinase [Bacteroidetes bacterium]|nr:histidine kinase [Bacteroidota bacterium]
MFMCSLATGLQAADWANWSNLASVTSIFQNGSKLWIGGRGGVVVIDTATQQRTVYIKTAGQLPSLMVEDMGYNAAMGTTWIGTYDNGLVKVHAGQFTTYNFPDSSVRLYHIAVDQAGNVWCATNSGLYKFNGSTYSFVAIPSNAWDVKLFPNGKLLIAGSKPLVYDPATDSSYVVNTNVFAYSASAIEVKDDSSYYFASDHGGIIYVQDTTAYDISDTSVVENFDPSIRQLKVLANGTLLALRSDAKVFSYNGSMWMPSAYSTDAESTQTNYLFQKNSGELLAGSAYHGGTVKGLNGATSISLQKFGIWSDMITAVKAKTDHEVWVMGGSQIGLYDVTANAFERIDTLPAATWSNTGGITAWNGTFLAFGYNSLYQWTGSAWTPLAIPGVNTFNITGIITDTSGGLYVATFDGLYIIHGSTVVRYYTANTGVFHNNDLIRDIHFDALRNTIWMATPMGIVRYTGGAFSIINSSNTPQISYYSYIRSITQDAAGDMWFGTAYGGLIRYDGSDYYVEVLAGSAGNQTVNGIAFDGNIMYAVDNVYGFWVKENGTWTNYNSKNSDITCDNMAGVYVDLYHNVWLTSFDYGAQNAFGIDIYNKTSIVMSVPTISDARKLTVYPNPASTLLTISDPSVEEGSEVTLTDAIGKSYSYKVSAHHIDVSQLAAGMYILHARTGTAPVKFIKQ